MLDTRYISGACVGLAMLVGASAAQCGVINFNDGGDAKVGEAFREAVSWTMERPGERALAEATHILELYRQREEPVRLVRREERSGGFPIIPERERVGGGSDGPRPEIVVPVVEEPKRPRLEEGPFEEVELAAVPVPGAGFLLLGGLGALALMRGRRTA